MYVSHRDVAPQLLRPQFRGAFPLPQRTNVDAQPHTDPAEIRGLLDGLARDPNFATAYVKLAPQAESACTIDGNWWVFSFPSRDQIRTVARGPAGSAAAARAPTGRA